MCLGIEKYRGNHHLLVADVVKASPEVLSQQYADPHGATQLFMGPHLYALGELVDYGVRLGSFKHLRRLGTILSQACTCLPNTRLQQCYRVMRS